MAIPRLLLPVAASFLILASACRDAPTPPSAASRQPLPEAPTAALPVASWHLEPGRPDAVVGLDGEAITVRRGPLGADRYLSRAYLDLPALPGAQYLFRYQAQVEGGGSGRVFAYVGDATTWDEKAIVWGPQLASGTSGPGLLPIVMPAAGTRIRLCVSAEGADCTARFSGLTMQMAIAPLALAPSTAAVTLDGLLDDALWADAAVLGPMRVLGDIGRRADLDTETLVAIRDGWLWLGVRCPEPEPERMRLTDRDEFGIFADDCIEVYVAKDRLDFSQVVVNGLGRHGWHRLGKPVDGRTWYPAADETAPGTVESAAVIDRGGRQWTCEMRLRLADILGTDRGGPTPLYLNVVRHRPQTAQEYVSWSLLPGATNHAPGHFAALALALPPAAAVSPAGTAAPLRLALSAGLGVPEVLLAATPLRLATGPGRFRLPAGLQIADTAGIDPGVLADLQAAAQVAGGGAAALSLEVAADGLDDPALTPAQRALLAGPEAFRLRLAGTAATIRGRSRAGVLRGIATLTLMAARARTATADLPELDLIDAPAMAVRGWMLHDSKPIAVTRRAIDTAFRLRLNHLLIAVDSFGGPTGFPFETAPIGDPQRTKQEWIDAFAYARARGIEPVPYIASWGRVQYLTRLPQYKHLMVSDRGLVQDEFRNLDVANPASHPVMLALQEELIEALKPSALCIAFDELHYAELVTSAAARAKKWKPSDWLVEALTVNADFLRSKGVRMWLWGDMLDPSQNGRQLDQSGPALFARLPRDMTILDWKYEGAFTGQADFPSFDMFKRQGLPTIGCPWFLPANVAAVADSARRHGIDGVIQTSWNSTDPASMKPELIRAVSLAARLSWSPGDADLSRLTVLPDAAFAYAQPARADAAWPILAQRPVPASTGLASEAEVASLAGWPGASLDVLAGTLRNPRGIALQPFQAAGRPAALPARDGASIAIGGPVKALTFLHATSPRRITGEMKDNVSILGNDVGTYVVHYADGSSVRIPLAYRRQVGGINDPAIGREMDPVVFGTLGGRHFANLSSHTWVNPQPGKEIRSVELIAGKTPDVTLMLFALTCE